MISLKRRRLIKRLQQGRWDVQRDTCKELKKLGDARAVPAILEVLRGARVGRELAESAADAVYALAGKDAIGDLTEDPAAHSGLGSLQVCGYSFSPPLWNDGVHGDASAEDMP